MFPSCFIVYEFYCYIIYVIVIAFIRKIFLLMTFGNIMLYNGQDQARYLVYFFFVSRFQADQPVID